MNVHAQAIDACAEGGGLLSIEQACERAAAYAQSILGAEEVPAFESAGRVLAQTIIAGIPLPPFDQSAMDGYALAAGDGVGQGTCWPAAARIAAGDRALPLAPGSAARIFTGAAIPFGADAVIAQEHVRRDGDAIVLGRALARGTNVRKRAEDISPGDELLSAGERLDARHLALLATQGLERVRVKRRPIAVVISTGSELRQPGTPLAGAAIYDSNRPMLLALTAEAGYEAIDGGSIADDASALARALTRFAGQCDLIVTTGGAASGDEDHAAAAMLSAGALFEVLRIALKPGKPAVIGRLGSAAYLGLPGNPVAALVSWLLLGSAITARLAGRSITRREGCSVRAAARFDRRPGRTEFVPARLIRQPDGAAAEILGRGGSARLRPLVLAEGLVEVAPFHAPVEAGSAVAFHPFRNGFTA